MDNEKRSDDEVIKELMSGELSLSAISTIVGDVNRFPSEANIFAYTGLVPRIYQSGNKEWKGHITKGNDFLKRTLVECVGIHIINAKDSPITDAYGRIRERRGNKKAKIAAARQIGEDVRCAFRWCYKWCRS